MFVRRCSHGLALSPPFDRGPDRRGCACTQSAVIRPINIQIVLLRDGPVQSVSHILLGQLYLLKLLLLLLRQADLSGAKVKSTQLLLDELSLAGRCGVRVRAGSLMAVVGSDLGSLGGKKLGMLACVLGSLHVLKLALGAHVLSALREPLLHDQPALLPALYGCASVGSSLILVLSSLDLSWCSSAHRLVLAHSCQGALAVRFAVVHQLVVACALWIARIHVVLVRAVRSTLPMWRQRVEVNLLGLLRCLVCLLARYRYRHLLELRVAVLCVATASSSCLSCLRNYLFRLLLLGAVVDLRRLALTFGRLRVGVHYLLDIAVVGRLVADALIVAVVEAHLDLLKLLETLRALHVVELLLVLEALHCRQLVLRRRRHLLALAAWLAAPSAATFLALKEAAGVHMAQLVRGTSEAALGL